MKQLNQVMKHLHQVMKQLQVTKHLHQVIKQPHQVMKHLHQVIKQPHQVMKHLHQVIKQFLLNKLLLINQQLNKKPPNDLLQTKEQLPKQMLPIMKEFQKKMHQQKPKSSFHSDN